MMEKDRAKIYTNLYSYFCGYQLASRCGLCESRECGYNMTC